MLTAHAIATALLIVHAKRIREAEVTSQAFAHARTEAGRLLADWAFADNAVDSEARRRIAAWVSSTGPRPHTVTLSGPNGLGKSVAATRWLGRKRAMFLRADALGREDWTGGVLARRAATVRRLVIDDLGSERGRAREHVCALLCQRHDDRLDTVATTVHVHGDKSSPVGSIFSEYPGSVHSRLAAGFIAVKGPDLRSSDEPVLDGIRRAEDIVRASERCRRLANVPEAVADDAVRRLVVLLGVEVDDHVRSMATELAGARARDASALADFAASMARKAVAIADARRRAG